ncbi:MAG: amidohydrolase [Sphingomonadales bacterium]|nr:MAG: amidohydrolase [Sphingomonadales bacterium]
MIVDAQIHVWGADCPGRAWPQAGQDGRTAAPHLPQPLSAAEILIEMEAAGVARAILVPPSWEGERNDIALAAATLHPRRFAVMGRIPTAISTLAGWRDTPGMLGARIILTSETEEDWLWQEAEARGVPLMIAPGGNLPLLSAIAHRHPALSITVDHMGARVHRTGPDAFAGFEHLLALAALPNVAVKATCLPAYSATSHPWADVTPYLRRLFDAFGPQRLFWGSDLSRLPCAYSDLVALFWDELDWLKGADRDLVMGKAIAEWLDWR